MPSVRVREALERLAPYEPLGWGALVLALLVLLVRGYGLIPGLEEHPTGGARYLGASEQALVEEQLLDLGPSPEPASVARAVVRLAGLSEAALIRYLAPVCRNRSSESRTAALRLLAGLESPLARDLLIRCSLQTDTPGREEILESLARRDRVATILQVARYLAPDESVSHRINAVFALGSLRAREVADTLLRLCRDDEELPFLRRACLSALRTLKVQSLRELLLEILEDPDESLAQSAAELLQAHHIDEPGVRGALQRVRDMQARPPGPRTLRHFIARYARRHELDPILVASVIEVESDYQQHVVSRSGAQGLMQLMPETARVLGVEDAFDPRQNIAGGTRYLRMMLDRFGDVRLALAAYNAGPTAVDRHGGIPPYPETQRYVQKVIRAYRTNLPPGHRGLF